jgi:hypothetical protein
VELDMLGVRIDSLEGRMLKVEEKTRTLDEALSNIHVEGFYEGSQKYVFRSNKYLDPAWDDPGLHPMSQKVNLRFIGNPRDGSGFNKNIESFVELTAMLSGIADNRLEYKFSDKPIPGDNVDDFVTNVRDDRRVSVNKAHFRSKAPLMDLRLFMGEQFTNLRDPAILLSASTFDLYKMEGAFSGIEASGKYDKWTYFTSVIKRHNVIRNYGGSLTDLYSEYNKDRENQKDAFSFRATFAPFSFQERGVTKEMLFGATYVETTSDYTTKDNFNRVTGWDMRYTSKANHSFDLTLNTLLSQGYDDVHDTGFKGDLIYENENLLMTLKGYTFGRDFQADVAANQYTDTHGYYNGAWKWDYNYGRKSTIGEKFLRLTSKYSFDESRLSVLDNLTMTLTGQRKWWEKLSGSENEDWYGRPATLLSLRTVGDFTDKTHVEFYNEVIKDARPDVKGKTKHTIDLDVKVTDNLNALGKVEFYSDFDYVVDGQHWTKTLGSIEMNSQVHPRLFLKGKITDEVQWSGRPNQKDTDIVDMESNYELSSKASWKQYLRRKIYDETAKKTAYKVTDYAISEMNVNFSRKLRATGAYAWQRSEQREDNNRKESFWNWYGRLRYEPTRSTDISLTYGYDWNDSSHSGVHNFEHTRQLVSLKAQTEF